MRLSTYYEGDQDVKVVAEDADLRTIEETLQGMDWSSIAFLTLSKDDNNHCEGSGSSSPHDGFCLTLKEYGVDFVSEAAPPSPQAMLPAFEAYLNGDIDRVLRIICDAEQRGLSDQDIADLKRAAVDQQGGRLAREVVAEAASLFRERKYAEYVAKVAPVESFLSATDQKKLALARKKAQ